MLKNKFNNRMIIDMTLYYIVLCVINLIILLFLAISSVNNANKIVVEKINNEFYSISLNINEKFKELDSISRTLNQNNTLKYLTEKKEIVNDSEYILLQDSIAIVDEYKRFNNFVSNIYFYCYESNALISYEAATVNGKEKLVNIFGELNFDNVESKTYRLIEKANGKSILIIDNNISKEQKPLVKIIFEIDSTEIYDVIKNKISFEINDIVIKDKFDNFLICYDNLNMNHKEFFSNNDAKKTFLIDKQRKIVKISSAIFNELDFLVIANYDKVFYFIKSNITDYVILWGVALVIGIILSIFFGIKNTKPYSKILDNFKQGNSKNISFANATKLIDNKIQNLIYDNDKIKKTLAEQIGKMQVSFLYNLLNGVFVTNEEIDDRAHYVDISLNAKNFVVLISTFEQEIQLDTLYIKYISCIIANITRQLEISSGVNYIFNKDTIYYILLLGESQENNLDTIDEISKLIICEFKENYNLNSKIAIGSIVRDKIDITMSFKHALQGVEFIRVKEPNEDIIWYYMLNKNRESFDFTYEYENRIFGLIKIGAEEKINKFIDDVYVENIEKRDLSNEMVNLLKNQILGSIIRICNKLNLEIEGELEKITSDENIVAFFEKAKNIFIFMLKKTTENKKEKSAVLIDKIIDYLQTNYSNTELSLVLLANKFEISEKYLSKIFKEKTGENFGNYVEDIRLKKATELLYNPELSIKEVISLVGYTNINTFYKAFKRKFGISPGEYK